MYHCSTIVLDKGTRPSVNVRHFGDQTYVALTVGDVSICTANGADECNAFLLDLIGKARAALIRLDTLKPTEPKADAQTDAPAA